MIKQVSNIKRYLVLLKKRYNSREKEDIIYRERLTLPIGIIFISLAWVLLIVAGYFVLDHFSSGNYLSGWLIFTASAVLLLIGLSAPHSIVVSNRNIILHGYIDMIQIPLEDVIEINAIPLEKHKNYFPIFWSFGFLGIYGFYYSFKNKQSYRIYTTRKKNWVQITTANQRYIINVKNPEAFVNVVHETTEKNS